MNKRIKVTGYFDIEEDEYDPGELGPLTEEKSLEMILSLGLDEPEFELADDD